MKSFANSKCGAPATSIYETANLQKDMKITN